MTTAGYTHPDWGMTANYSQLDADEQHSDWLERSAPAVRTEWLQSAISCENELIASGELSEADRISQAEMEKQAQTDFKDLATDYSAAEKADIVDYWRRHLAA